MPTPPASLTNPDPNAPKPFNPWNPDDDPKSRSRFPKLETPFRVRHVETHLIFGPIARYIPLIPVALGAFVIFYLVLLVMSPENGPHGAGLFLAGGGLAALSRVSYRQQAIIGWIATKLVLAVVCINVIPLSLGLWLANHNLEARPFFFLGLLWLPGLEFIPKLTPNQRYLTLARLLLSIPCVFDIIRQSGKT